MKRFLPIAIFTVAVASMAFVLFPMKQHEINTATEAGYLASKIPQAPGAATSIEKPLGATEEVARAAEQILHTSDFFNREYTLGNGKTFTLYISFWRPNKESIITASTHTPDRCWIVNGWKADSSKSDNSKKFSIDGKEFIPAYYREYTVKTQTNSDYRRKVLFWFIVDGKRYEYNTSTNYIPNPINWVENILSETLNGIPQMYFIRIDSEEDIFEMMKDNDMQTILKALGDMTLFEKKESKNEK